MRCNALAGWMLVPVLAANPAVLSAQVTVPSPVARVEVLLTIAPTLPSAVRAALMEEATAIWRQQHVSIDWLPSTDPCPPAQNRLRAIVIERATPAKVEGPFAVGELVRSLNSHPIG